MLTTADDESGQFSLPDGTLIVHRNKGETEFVYREIFEEHAYLKHGVTLAGAKCVFDVGANIGLFSLYVSRIAPDAAIFAFEPMPQIYDALRANRALCAMDKLRPYPYGLAGKSGFETFTYYPQLSIISGKQGDAEEDARTVHAYLLNQLKESGVDAAAASALVKELVKTKLSCAQVRCELRTLSEVIHEHRIERIDLLKIDAEKSELDVLTGIAPADWPKIRQAVVEVHDICGELRRARDLFEQQGFRVVAEQDKLLSGTQIYMLYATRGGND